MDEQQFDIGDNPELESYLKRNFNALKEQNILVRKQAILQIYERIRDQRLSISGSISQQILLKFSKDLLKAFSDSSEQVREYAIMSLMEILSRCDDMQPVLPYLFAVLTERSNCHDLEGITHLPEVMRPPPDQKPRVLISLVEQSEELRVKLVDLMSVIVSCNNSEALHEFIDEIVNILRAFCMDPYGAVQKAACQCLSEFCRNNHSMLLHFTEPMARALLFPLISKKSKIKIAALEAMGSVLECGIWKHNAFVFEILTGFRDPNSVPIKAFYEPMHNINYLATLIIDPKEQVREMFIGGVGDWLTRLADRWDHHARLVPYILSGLFDDSADIREASQVTIEQVGIEWEKEREKDIKECQQLGVESEWTLNGQLVDLPLPDPFTKRPRLGARGFIRNQVRKMWGALYKELKDSNEQNRVRASNLVVMGVLYSEDYMTQFMDHFIPNTITSICYKESDSKAVKLSTEKIQLTYNLLGRFCNYKAYLPTIFAGIKGEYSKDEWYMQCAMSALNSLLNGALEATINGVGDKILFLEEIIDMMSEKNQIEHISSSNYQQAEDLLHSIIVHFREKATVEEQDHLFKRKGPQLLNLLNVLQYVSQFGQTILINLPLDSTLINHSLAQLKDNKPMQLKTILYTHFQAIVNKQDIELISFQDNQWKVLVSDLTYGLVHGHYVEDQLNLIYALLEKLGLPEIADFITKYCNIMLHHITKCRPQLTECFTSLLALQSQAMQWLSGQVKELQNKKQNDFLFKQIYQTLDLITQKDLFALQWKYIQKDALSLQKYTLLMISLAKLHQTVFKTKFNELIYINTELLQRCLPYPTAKQLKFNDTYLIPYYLQYIFDEIDILGDTPKPDSKNKLLICLSLVLQYIPNAEETTYYGGDPQIVDQYQVLLGKIIKYTIEEKDLGYQDKYLQILKTLRQKTPHNFYIEYENAKKGNQITRVELLRKYIN